MIQEVMSLRQYQKKKRYFYSMLLIRKKKKDKKLEAKQMKLENSSLKCYKMQDKN